MGSSCAELLVGKVSLSGHRPQPRHDPAPAKTTRSLSPATYVSSAEELRVLVTTDVLKRLSAIPAKPIGAAGPQIICSFAIRKDHSAV